MTQVIAGLLGFVLGLAAHDLAIQSLSNETELRPLVGVCPDCGHKRGWHRPTCAACGRRVQREPVVALVSALAAVGFLHTVGTTWLAVPFLGFLLLSTALVVTDLEEFRIVDRLNLRGSLMLAGVLAIAALAEGELIGLLRGLGGAAAYFGGAALLWMVVRGRGFGAGDVKLAPLLGLFTAFLSWETLGWSVFATALIGGVIALAMLAMGAAKMKTELPYGPPMVLGAWLAIVLQGIGSL